jgi:hypothetical protein
MARRERCETVPAQVLRCLPDARIELLDNVLDAILHSARRPPDLLLLDFAIDGAAAPALIGNLSRIAPATQVMVFDDLEDGEGARNGTVRGWSELDRLLLAWTARRQAADPGLE